MIWKIIEHLGTKGNYIVIQTVVKNVLKYVARFLLQVSLVYGQMNEPPGARARVALTGLTVAEYFRDQEGQDVLLFIDNIFRFTQAGSEVHWSALTICLNIDLLSLLICISSLYAESERMVQFSYITSCLK